MAAPLTKYGGMQVFSDTDIAAGALWRSTIQKSLDKSTVVVLLVSRHFLKSPFITDVELPYILKARNSRGLSVLWVLVSHCLYEETPLQPIQAAFADEHAAGGYVGGKAERSLEKSLRTSRESLEGCRKAEARPVAERQEGAEEGRKSEDSCFRSHKAYRSLRARRQWRRLVSSRRDTCGQCCLHLLFWQREDEDRHWLPHYRGYYRRAGAQPRRQGNEAVTEV